MHRTTCVNLCLLSGLAVLAWSATVARAESRDWTARDGRTLSAEFMGIQGEGNATVVKLKLASGKVVDYPIVNLSEKDLTFLKSVTPALTGVASVAPGANVQQSVAPASSSKQSVEPAASGRIGRPNWPLLNGQTVAGNLLSTDGAQVTLISPDGQEARYALRDFHPAAQREMLKTGGLPGRAAVFDEVYLQSQEINRSGPKKALPGHHFVVLEGPLALPKTLTSISAKCWGLRPNSPDHYGYGLLHYGSCSVSDLQDSIGKNETPKFSAYARDQLIIFPAIRTPFSGVVFCFQIEKVDNVNRFVIEVGGLTADNKGYSEYRVCELRPDNVFGHARQWTNAQGKVFNADLLNLEGGHVRFRMGDGKQMLYPLNQLSTNDFNWLKSVSLPRN